jgi:glutamine kinase
MSKIKRTFTKAESLHILKKNEKKLSIKVPSFIYFTKKKYKKDYKKILNRVQKIFKKKKLIIRSSSQQEDNIYQSNAGKFKSFQNLSTNKEEVDKSINKIIKDFENDNDQIIVQEFIHKPKMSGVIFTRNLNNNSPYYTINFDKSGFTNLITSGADNPLMKTVIIMRGSKNFSKFFKKELKSVTKIEKLFNNDRLDLEFCITKNTFYIFQCRPLKKLQNIDDEKFDQAIINVRKKIKKIQNKIPNLSGKTTYFANMSDWNPAEMIGVKPSPLSLSLYSELITDEVWAEQRNDYGYQDVRPNPLMINFAGSPYIDLRVDFNSFLPSDLPKKIKEKSINYYLNKIKKNPSLQDKIEFELIETCYDFSTKKNLCKFLSKKESDLYSKQLKDLTNKILINKPPILDNELKKIIKLNDKIEILKKSKLSEVQKIFFYIKDCKKLGTLPFAGTARLAFVSTKLLRSLVTMQILTEKDLEEFYQSIPTITKQMKLSYSNLRNKKDIDNFLKKYGHLRPSTYSISSKNYKENFKEYFNKKNNPDKNIIRKKLSLSKGKEIQINKLLKKHGLKINCKRFLDFASKSISLREYTKLIFSKSINQIFHNLIKLSKEIKMSRRDLEYISIKNFITHYSGVNVEKLKTSLNEEIKKNKRNEKFLNLIEFPEFISDEKDICNFEQKTKKGNFITNKIVEAEIIRLEKIKDYSNLNNKIVLIKNADPGYDFIFSYKIKGLITEYGGANSHMSIRCLELGIPAIIGIGKRDYNLLSRKNFITINSKQKYYRIVR